MTSVFKTAKELRDLPKEEPSPDIQNERTKTSIFQKAQQLPPSEEKPGLISEGLRHTGRGIARVAETALSAPREGAEFLQSLVPEKAIVKGAEKIGLGKGAKNLLETSKKYAPHKLLPSSKQVREFTKDLFGEKLEPKNEWEKKTDELIGDFTALALPFPGQKLKILKPALVALGGNIASEIVGWHGGSEKSKTNAKLGTFLTLSMINPGGTRKLTNDLYSEARSNRPPDAKVSAQNLSKKVNDMRTELSKGGTADSKTKSLKKLDEIENAIKNGEIEIEELEKFKTSINETSAGLYEEFKSNRPGREAAKRNLNRVSKAIDESLTEYGKKNPAWEQPYRTANEVHGAIAQSRKARKWLIDKKKALGPVGALSLFGIEQSAGIVPTAIAAGAGTAGLMTGELAVQVFKSPELAKYYAKVIEAALRDDVVAAKKNLNKLQEEMED